MKLPAFTRSLWFALAIFAAGMAVVVWLRQERAAAIAEEARRERIGSEARESIHRATEGIRLCPLSQPDCNDRRTP